MGSVQFQIVPCSSLYFSRSTGPFQCSHCYLQGFNLLHLSLPKRFPLVYFGFLCLQVSLVSNFHPDTRGRRWSFIQVHLFNCAAEGGTLQTYITGVCGECSQCLGHTGFAPSHGVCAFPVYTAQAPGCSAGELSKVGPGLRALPRSKLLKFRFLGTPQQHRLGWASIVCPSQV